MKVQRNGGQGNTAVVERPEGNVQQKQLVLKANAPVRKYGREKDTRAFWYLKREGELSVVTANAQNPALGITKIEMFPATEKQKEKDILCKVRMYTLCGIDENITIFASNRTAGDIYLRVSGARKVEKDDKVNWYHDRKLNKAAAAQILSHVHQYVEVV